MENNNDLLAKVDEVRKRHKVSYEEAKLALEINDYNTLDAIIYLENQKGERFEEIKGYSDKTLETIKKSSKGNVVFTLKKNSVEAPIPVAAIGTLLLARKPKLLVAIAIGLFAIGTDIKVEKGDKVIELTKPCRAMLKSSFDKIGFNKENIVKNIDGMGNKIHFGKSDKNDEGFPGYFSSDVY
ncbi:MAG: hypothetical protein WBI17_02790 [Clostridiaceae bacterium]